MKPYGAGGNSLPHIKQGGAPDGYWDTFKAACKCCDGPYCKGRNHRQLNRSMKRKARREGRWEIKSQLRAA